MIGYLSLLRFLFTISFLIVLCACENKVNFSTRPTNGGTELPSTIPPVDEFHYEYTKGLCASGTDTKLLSCMSCQTPEPAPLTKGQTLAEVAYVQCQIRNGSDPSGYVPPTKAEIQRRLRNCTADVYPNTSYQASEKRTMDAILGDDPWLRYKMFSGLYYQPPYSDDFASYFVLEVGESRHIFCYRSNYLPPDIYPVEWWQSDDRWNYQIPDRWINANKIRSQLIACLQDTSNNPVPVPAKATCDYQTMSGPMSVTVLQKMLEWHEQGYVLGFESPTAKVCLAYEGGTTMPATGTTVKVAAYRCLNN